MTLNPYLALLLFALLWAVKDRPWRTAHASRWPHGSMLALFLALYACFRFVVEFVREPDPQIGLIGLVLSTFTTKFVFPLVSLEGRRFWILGLLPIRRETILWSTFLFAAVGSLTISSTVSPAISPASAVALRRGSAK